ncbi:hypothetical protein [Terracidiphilus gabretensis]|uniref:hypothetical protein n=1 Tax=Terracidiphilus gabretensis TaxID=1577687 RepID=UPI0018D24E70|nr:hypothetical protein [Terracidiphilus gabretensis]
MRSEYAARALALCASFYPDCEENSLLQTDIADLGTVLQTMSKTKTDTPERARFLELCCCDQNNQMLTRVAAMAAAATAW